MKRYYRCIVKFDDGTLLPFWSDAEHLDLATVWLKKEFPLMSQYQHVTEITEWELIDYEEGEDEE